LKTVSFYDIVNLMGNNVILLGYNVIFLGNNVIHYGKYYLWEFYIKCRTMDMSYSKRPYQILSFCKKDKIPKIGSIIEGGHFTKAKISQEFINHWWTLETFSLRQMPSFNHKSNINDFVFSWKYQNLIGPLLWKWILRMPNGNTTFIIFL